MEPTRLRYAGGQVTVWFRVDAEAVAEPVSAALLDSASKTVFTTSAKQSGDAWRAELEVPPNLGTDGQSAQYIVRVLVLDVLSCDISREATVVVAAAEPPPSSPP